MRKIGVLLIKEIVIVIVCAVAGVAALAITYLIPRGNMQYNVRKSIMVLHEEGLGERVWQDIEETALDSYTDGLILNTCYTETKNGIRDILLGTRVKVGKKNPMESLYETEILANDDYTVKEYGRYWHGYQILLRPLLCFFTYSDIRQINMIVQLALVFILVCVLAGSANKVFVVPFLMLYLFLCPVSLYSSLQYSPCFYIMMLALIVLAAFGGRLSDTGRSYVFLLAGIMTAFFDLLTYPFITLGVPLIACLALDNKPVFYGKKCMEDCFFHTLSWCTGYLGMWSAKWVLTTVLTGENILYEAFEEIKYRSGYFGEKHSYFDTLKLNLGVCNWKVLAPAAACIGIAIIIVRMKNCIGINRGLLPLVGMFLVVSLYPFAWYLFTKEHSSNHSYFTWRELGISVFGILMSGVTGIRGICGKMKEIPDDAPDRF